jgi:hypothetical protein
MQATFENRSYETFNQSWNAMRLANQTRPSFNSLASPFASVPQRSMDAHAASRASNPPTAFAQQSRGMSASFDPYGRSAPQSGYGRMQQASMTNFSREVVRTPDGGMMSKTSFTRVQQPSSQHNPVPDSRCRDYNERCRDNRSNQTAHVPMSVTSNGNDLNVRMGNDTTLNTKKSDSDLFLNTKTKDGHDVSISSTGDPHASLSIDGKQIAKGDYKDPFRVKVDDKDITMIPEEKKNNNGPAPYLDKAVIQQKDGSMYVMEHLSQADKSSNPTYREVTDSGERAALNSIATNAHTATYQNGQMIDSTTRKPITNADINAH